MEDLRGKAVLITGAGRGIGKRLAIGFAAAGAKVALLARSKAELELTHLEIEHAGGTAIRVRGDVRDAVAMESAVERTRAHLGDIDVLVCAAGIQGPIGPFVDNPAKAWIDTIETNLFGVVHACHAVLPEMIRRRAGKIIALGGGGGLKMRPNFTSYSASKAGLIRFIESLAAELEPHNVQANVMAPSGAYTHMTDQVLDAGDRAGEKEIEIARQIRLTGGVPPERQIGLALFLASSSSNHITGKMIHVDDEWQKLAKKSIHPELYTLRRVVKV